MGLGIATKLLELLSEKNVRFLDTILGALTRKTGSPVYSPFWNWFATQYPNNDKAMKQAYAALSKLHEIVSEYRFSKRM
jgi:hypothetical protein